VSGLSLGSVDALDRDHLRRLKRLVDRVHPALVSEHVCWGSIGGVHLNDLLPLPYTGEALRHLAARVGELQDFLGRQVLLENVSSYLTFTCSELSEPEFLTALVRESGCGLLLDINNVYVSARNHGFDARAFIAQLPATRSRRSTWPVIRSTATRTARSSSTRTRPTSAMTCGRCTTTPSSGSARRRR
jgi:uncharacterized protein (UPF0276 family)